MTDQDVSGHSAESGAQAQDQAGAPAMPVIGSGEHLGDAPCPLLDGLSPTIGWQFRPSREGGPAFVIIRRRFGFWKVVEDFPLTEGGWAAAWRSLVRVNRGSVPQLLAALHARDAARLAVPGQPVAGEVSVPLPVGKPQASTPGKAEARALADLLKQQLGRDVSVPGEGGFKKVVRVATNPSLVLGAATVGGGIATVLTAGTVHVVLGAVSAGVLGSNGSKAIDWWKSRKQGTVYLDSNAVGYLLSLNAPNPQAQRQLQVKAVRAVLSASPSGDVRITMQQLIDASNRPRNPWRLSRAGLGRVIRALRSPYGLAGLALLSAGLFLTAVTVIPEYIQDPSLRVAVAVSAIGGILIAIAVTEEFKTR